MKNKILALLAVVSSLTVYFQNTAYQQLKHNNGVLTKQVTDLQNEIKQKNEDLESAQAASESLGTMYSNLMEYDMTHPCKRTCKLKSK